MLGLGFRDGTRAFWAHVGGFVAGMILMPLLHSVPRRGAIGERNGLIQFDDQQWTRVD